MLIEQLLWTWNQFQISAFINKILIISIKSKNKTTKKVYRSV